MRFLTNRSNSGVKQVFLRMFLLFFATNMLFAQDFEVAPVLIGFTANPGEIETKTITIRNHFNERQKFMLNLSDYTIDEDGTKHSMEAGTSSRTIAQWLTINPAFVELNPNESTEVQLIMTVPRNGFTTRWGMIHVEVAREQLPSSVDKELATGVLLIPRIVVLLKQSPRSNQNFKGTVSNLNEVTKEGDEFRSFEASITNQGDKILEAKTFLALANLKTMEEKQLSPKNVNIYPGQTRNVSLQLTETPDPGRYALAFLMDYGHRSIIEGAQMLIEVE